MKENSSRRKFLKEMFGGFGVIMVSRVSWLFPEHQVALGQTEQAFDQTAKMFGEDIGELYEGFLILPDIDSPSNSLEGSAVAEKQTTEFVSIPEALNHTDIPLYLPNALPNGIEFSKVSLQEYKSATKPHLVTVSYSSSETEDRYPAISISARTDFPQPFPIRPVHAFQNNDSHPELVFPDRVSFTPTPGIMLPSVIGYGLHWIENETLYTLIHEYTVDRDAVVNFVSFLEKHI